MTVRIGIIGLGYWGKNILRNLYDMKCLALACDSSQATIDERKKSFPEAVFTTNINDVFLSKEIDAVVISSPAATHYQIVKQALNAGKDVFVEKPLALNVAEGEELVRLAREKSRILMVGHILQYHPAVITLKDMIRKGDLGKIQYVYSNRLNIGKLRTEENIIWSFAPHDISVILSLVGDVPANITAVGASYLNDDVYDVTLTSLEFHNRVKAHIFVSWLHPFKEQKLVVVGSQGMAVFDDVTKEKLFFYPHQIKWEDGKIPVAQKADCRPVPIEDKEPLKEELAHFAACVASRSKPRTDGEEGLAVLRILDGIEKAIVANKPRG